MYNLHSPSHYLYLFSYEHVQNKHKHILNKQQQQKKNFYWSPQYHTKTN